MKRKTVYIVLVEAQIWVFGHTNLSMRPFKFKLWSTEQTEKSWPSLLGFTEANLTLPWVKSIQAIYVKKFLFWRPCLIWFRYVYRLSQFRRQLTPVLRRLGYRVLVDGGYRGEDEDVLQVTRRHGRISTAIFRRARKECNHVVDFFLCLTHPQNENERNLASERGLVECVFGCVFDKLWPLLSNWPQRPIDVVRWAKYMRAGCLLYNWLLKRRPDMKQFWEVLVSHKRTYYISNETCCSNRFNFAFNCTDCTIVLTVLIAPLYRLY